MPVVRKRLKGKDYWRIRLSKRPERHMLLPASIPIETVREYSRLARAYIKGEDVLNEIKQHPELYMKLHTHGYIDERPLLSIHEAADVLGISYGYLCCLSLGAQYPMEVEVVGSRRYFNRQKLIQWAQNFMEKVGKDKEAWKLVPTLFSAEFLSASSKNSCATSPPDEV